MVTVDAAAFVVNPASANGRTGKRWPQIATRAAAAGLGGEYHLSEGVGQIAEIARKAAESGARLVIAVGGDGTVSEVVQGLLTAKRRPSPELAVIPCGTGSDFARNFAIPTHPDAAISIAIGGIPSPLDAGRVRMCGRDGSESERYFINVASAGLSGAVAARANAQSKMFGGTVSYLRAALGVLPRWQPCSVLVTADVERREGMMHAVFVANCRYSGGGMQFCPGADPSDGFFDVLLVKDLSRPDLVRTLPKVYRGTHLPHPNAELLRARSVTITTASALPIELDGEQPGTTPATFVVEPSAIRLRVPAAGSMTP